MNLPNKLTLGRLVLTLLFVIALSVDFPSHKLVGLVLFILAAVTDYLDGLIARRTGTVTTFGKLMDPLADKVMMAAAFVILSTEGLIAGWAVVAILAREFLVTGLRLVATSQGVVLAADSLGKLKTILQIATAIFLLVVLAGQEPAVNDLSFESLIGAEATRMTGLILVYLTVLTTIGSGLSYLFGNRKLFEGEM